MNYQILVNKYHLLTKDYLKDVNLVEVKDINNETILIEEETLKHYFELEKYLKTKKIIIGIDGAYRSIEEQKNLYQRFCKQYGEDYAKKIGFAFVVNIILKHAIDLSLSIEDKFIEENSELLEHLENLK